MLAVLMHDNLHRIVTYWAALLGIVNLGYMKRASTISGIVRVSGTWYQDGTLPQIKIFLYVYFLFFCNCFHCIFFHVKILFNACNATAPYNITVSKQVRPNKIHESLCCNNVCDFNFQTIYNHHHWYVIEGSVLSLCTQIGKLGLISERKSLYLT